MTTLLYASLEIRDSLEIADYLIVHTVNGQNSSNQRKSQHTVHVLSTDQYRGLSQAKCMALRRIDFSTVLGTRVNGTHVSQFGLEQLCLSRLNTRKPSSQYIK